MQRNAPKESDVPHDPLNEAEQVEEVNDHIIRQINAPAFEWSTAKQIAAMELAMGDLSLPQIAKKVGVSRATLCRWRLQPAFAIRVQENQAEIRAVILSTGIADLAERIAAKNRRWLALQEIIVQRAQAAAKDPQLRDVPGMVLGLMIARQRMIGSGENARVVTDYQVDFALLQELRALEMDAARELGQLGGKGVKGGNAEHCEKCALVPLDPYVAYGYPLGTAADIMEEFMELLNAGVDPVQHYKEQSKKRMEEDEAKKAAEAAAAGR